MTILEKYLAAQLEEMYKQNKRDWIEGANRIIEKMCDPDYTPPVEKVKKNSTKCASYANFLQEYPGEVHQTIYDSILESDEPLSRQEISNLLGIRLSTVCGRVAELIDSGMIVRDGKKVDTSTKRMVETLSPRIKPEYK
jgi:hypothetical protein